MLQKPLWVRTGDFWFKYRNGLFPLIVAALLLGLPPAQTYGGRADLVVMKDLVAYLLVGGGLVFRAAVVGYAYIKRGGLNKKVYAENLVTEGFFGLCRNPLYVGNMLVYAGLFAAHGNPLVFLVGTGGFYLIYKSLIAAEEYFLTDKFGAAYLAYCHDVPRWLPRLGLFKQATEGMQFNFKRVITKDYTTWATALLGMGAIKFLRDFYASAFSPVWSDFSPYVLFLTTVLIAVAGIKMAKKKKLL